MNKLFNTCRRCLNPWVAGTIALGVVVLLIVFPVIGVAGLIVVLPLIGCTVMCGAMAFMMRGEKHKDK